MRANILIIQFRKDKRTAIHESKCFYKTMKDVSNVHIVNAFSKKDPLKRLTPSRFNGIILAGSGNFSFSEKNVNFPLKNKVVKTIPWVKNAINNNVPVLGVCLGHQYIAKMLGSEIIKDAKQKEVGTFQITLSDAGKTDPLFFDLPETFLVQQGHQDSVKPLPKRCVLLAYGEKCKIQSFKVKKQNVYGVQFHPELNKEDSEKRLKLSSRGYALNSKSNGFAPSPLAKKVLANFVRINKSKEK